MHLIQLLWPAVTLIIAQHHCHAQALVKRSGRTGAACSAPAAVATGPAITAATAAAAAASIVCHGACQLRHACKGVIRDGTQQRRHACLLCRLPCGIIL